MGNPNDQDVIEQLKDELRKLAHDKIMQEELINRLESKIGRTKDKNKELKGRVNELE